jgi:hypothetical protein
MAKFNVVKLLDAVTITGPEGPQGPTGATGATGATGPGAGVFEVDSNGGLMPCASIISEAFYEYDGNGDVMPKA